MVFVTTREYNVDGAPSTPIGLDPLAGKPILRDDMAASAEERIAQQLIAAGYPEAQARRLAAAHAARLGPTEASAFADRNAKRPDELAAAAAEAQAADLRHAQMKADYDIATGLGPASPQTQAQWANSEANAREAGRIIRSGLHPQTPVDPGTPEQQASWNQFLKDNPDEMQRYRPQEFAAQQAASKAKEDVSLYDNIKRKYGESEAQAWLAARQQGQVYVPHFANQTSANENRRALEIDAAKGGAGSPASRALLNAADERYTDAVSRPRWAREAGLSQDAEATTSMSDGDLRLAAANKRAADKRARDLQWRAMVMMRAGNFTGALALPGMDEAMRSSILNQQNAAMNANRPGGPLNFGPTPLGVEAMHNEQLTELGKRVATGQGFQQVPQALVDVQRQTAEDKARKENPEAAGARDLANHDFTTAESRIALERMAEQHDTGGDFFGTPEQGTSIWWLPGSGAMSNDDEEALRIAIRDRFNISDEEAAYLARDAANSRRRGPMGGNWSMRPALPRPGKAPTP